MHVKPTAPFRLLALAAGLGLVATAAAQFVPGGPAGALGPRTGPNPLARANPRPPTPAASELDAVIRRWNTIAVDASGLDHTPVAAGESRTYGEQLGPCRSSRAMAIVHLAMFEALNAFDGRFQPHIPVAAPRPGASREAALAQAARDALTAMFPSQAARFDAFLAEDLAAIPNGPAEGDGIAHGRAAARAVVARRANDGSNHTEAVLGVDYFPPVGPGKWRQDPVSLVPIALGAKWATVRPFTLTRANQFRLPPPPALDSLEHAMAYVEVKRLGGDGVTTRTERAADQTHIGIFWAYDGTPSLCAPPRLYNQVARTVAAERGTTGPELLRLLTVLNVAMADTAIAAWDSKYHYAVARPVTEIRDGQLDGNPDTVADSTYLPLGAPASNLTGPNFTPPFPAYPSGHAAFGGALFQTLRNFYRTDRIPFTFTSDEFNGVTLDNQGNVRPNLPRSFETLTEAELENAESRVYLGIHWSYDASSGILQGREVADHVGQTLYRPVGGGAPDPTPTPVPGPTPTPGPRG